VGNMQILRASCASQVLTFNIDRLETIKDIHRVASSHFGGLERSMADPQGDRPSSSAFFA